MDIVSDYLRRLIARQVDDHGLVLWFDPDGHYRAVASELAIPNAAVARYNGSFFALRHEIEPLIGGFEPPRLVVYVPFDPADTFNALVELEAAGIIVGPGQQPPIRNSRLSIIARNALKPTLGEETAAAIEKQVEGGKLTLADLDALAERGKGITRGVVAVIFGTGNPPDVALHFLSSDRHDSAVADRGAVAELADLFRETFDSELSPTANPAEMRIALARHVLITDLIASIRDAIPRQLSTVKAAARPMARAACLTLAKTWRLRQDLRESYVSQANRVEQELGLAGIDFNRDQIAEVETFLGIEKALQRSVEDALQGAAVGDLEELARARLSCFWSEHLPDVQARWALIAVCGQVLLEADRIAGEIRRSAADVKAIFAAYTETDRPWCVLDTYHRHMERRYHNFDFNLADDHRTLEQLIVRARDRYMEVGSALAEHFLRHYQEARFRLPGVLRQTEVFDRKVKPRIAEGKTAYVWVDALRYEMARELAQILSDDFGRQMEAAMGTVPTITEIGMAALLPGAQNSAIVVAVGEGKLAMEIDGTVLKDRKDRVKLLKAQPGVHVFDARLDDLLPSPKKAVREGIRDADLILITSQEIDALCEGDNVPLARRTMDEVLHELRKAFRSLAQLGVQTIVVAADHGYVFGDELRSEMKIDAPGGETVDLHRRVWVGRGGTADPAFLRAALSDFGLGAELEIAVPWTFACFKVKGGARAYFHGGMSPQEIIIPVLTLTPKKKELLGLANQVAWTLTPGSQKISTRFFSVQIKGVATGLFEFVPPRVRIEIRARGDCISTPISASYGFEEATGDVQLKRAADDPRAIEPNTVTLMITKETSQKNVAIHLLDATTGVLLARLEPIQMAIAI